jgi:hypothetical protein
MSGKISGFKMAKALEKVYAPELDVLAIDKEILVIQASNELLGNTDWEADGLPAIEYTEEGGWFVQYGCCCCCGKTKIKPTLRKKLVALQELCDSYESVLTNPAIKPLLVDIIKAWLKAEVH